MKWLLFIVLAFIWGSSFILMKEGMLKLTPYQVASLRIIFSGLILLPIAWKAFQNIPRNKKWYAFLSGILGSLLPAYLFCIAELKIDSSLAGTLNSLTPVFVILTGVMFFQQKISWMKILGILIAFSGSLLLLVSKSGFTGLVHGFHTSLIVIATIMYGFNVNIVHRHLKSFPALQVVSLAMFFCSIPALAVLIYSGFFQLNYSNELAYSVGASLLLGVFGTALASILFYRLINKAGIVFASLVTYGIPFVANFWGLLYGEDIGWLEIISLIIILAGVYLANRPAKPN